MKKILSMVISLLAAFPAFSQQEVKVAWPFAVGSPQANMVRALIDSANAQQSKYTFVFFSKPGAGGAVAANYVNDSKELSVLISSSSFYIRPLLYKDSHSVDNFSLTGTMCIAQPLAIFSKLSPSSFSSKPDISLGIIPGSITSLVSRVIQKENPRINLREIPYKGTPEATTDMLGGHIDGSVDFIGKSSLGRFDSSVSVIGITGKKSIKGFPTFQSLNIRGLEEVSNDYFIFVKSGTDIEIGRELNSIFSKAMTAKVSEICEDDFGTPFSAQFESTESIHNQNKIRWQKLTQGFSKE